MSHLALVYGDWAESGQPLHIGNLRSTRIRICRMYAIA